MRIPSPDSVRGFEHGDAGARFASSMGRYLCCVGTWRRPQIISDVPPSSPEVCASSTVSRYNLSPLYFLSPSTLFPSDGVFLCFLFLPVNLWFFLSPERFWINMTWRVWKWKSTLTNTYMWCMWQLKARLFCWTMLLEAGTFLRSSIEAFEKVSLSKYIENILSHLPSWFVATQIDPILLVRYLSL